MAKKHSSPQKGKKKLQISIPWKEGVHVLMILSTADGVLEVVAATESVRGFLLAQVTVVEGGYSPHLLPRGTDKLLSTSVQYAALLGQSPLWRHRTYRILEELVTLSLIHGDLALWAPQLFYAYLSYSGTWSNRKLYFGKIYFSVVSSER